MPVKLNFPFPIVLDIITVALLLFFLWRGKRRGLIKTIAGILVLILAFVGAGLLAKSTAPAISEKLVTPHVTEFLTPKAAGLSDATPGAFYEMLLTLGIPESLAQNITDSSPMSDMLLNASKTIGEKVTYALLCLIYFIALLLILKCIFGLLDRVFDLPILSFVNGLGGLLCGGIWGYLFIMLLGTIFLNAGLFFDRSTLSQTHILGFIISTNPFSLISMKV